MTPAAVFEAMGLRYVGPQEMPKGRPEMYWFDAPDNSSLLMPAPVTKQTVEAKLAEHRRVIEEIRGRSWGA